MVMKIVGDHLGIPGSTLNPKMDLTDDLGADSLDKLELMMTLEELFKIKISDKDLSKIQRISNMIEAIKHAKETGV